jgi:hypothetical protein
MKFRDYFLGLNLEGRAEFAKRSGLAVMYIQCHLISEPPRKVPAMEKIINLAKATQGFISEEEMFRHFRSAIDAGMPQKPTRKYQRKELKELHPAADPIQA